MEESCTPSPPASSTAGPGITVPQQLRAANQIARAEYHHTKAQAAMQGAADRLWRDRTLGDLDSDERARMAAWVHRFSEQPKILRGQQHEHDMVMFARRFLN